MTNTVVIEEALEDLFSSSDQKFEVQVDLPSRAKGYVKTQSSIKIRSMTYEDEKFIASYSGGALLDDLIARCVIDVDLDELYLEDKLFLYFKLREVSFGSMAKMEASCNFCGFSNELEIDLSKLKVDYAEEDFEDPKEIMLPGLKKVAFVSKMRSHLQKYSVNDTELLENLWRFIKKIGEYEDPVVLSKAVKKLSSVDVRVIMAHINNQSFGLDSRAKFICNKCRKENTASIGLNLDFFTVS